MPIADASTKRSPITKAAAEEPRWPHTAPSVTAPREAVDIDIVKLDGSWVQQIHTNPIAREMIAATVRCAKLLNLTVIAEWIEDLNDLHALQTLGVEWGQGYYFGKPRPLPEILAPYTGAELVRLEVSYDTTPPT